MNRRERADVERRMVASMWVLDPATKLARRPKDFAELVRFLEPGSELRRVAEDFVTLADDKVARVSTVFLCVDHQWGDGDPVLFETMVFGGPLDGWQWRYCYHGEAMTGHVAAVEQCKQATPA
jgi:hypothetical protein